ncbi:Uncharacterised protein [Bacteroides uniformis]|uniref:Uncharacterized protein n=3 Tax=Bacteroides uniformis TaxID=820 RepID=A0A174GN46_BACUN|nr:Uncharacterised protein [Bacteroides uniformis]
MEFGLLFAILHNILYQIHCAGNEYSIAESGKELFYLTIRLTSSEPLIVAMWFCPALLLTSIITILIQSSTNKVLKINIIQVYIGGGGYPILIFIIGYMALQLHIKSPYCIWHYMVLSLIIWMGYWFKRRVKAEKWNTTTHTIVMTTGFALIALATNYGVMARLQPTNIQSQSIIALALIPTLAGLSAYSLSY